MLVALLKGEAWDHEENVIPSRLVIRGSTAKRSNPDINK
jgi:hypothetical protein